MGIFNLVLCIFATYICYNKGLTILALICLIITCLNIWSFSIMCKFRNSSEGIPKLWILINFLTSFAGLIFLVIAL